MLEDSYMTEDTRPKAICLTETLTQSIEDGVTTIQLTHVRGRTSAQLSCVVEYEGDQANEEVLTPISKHALECLLVMITNALKDMP